MARLLLIRCLNRMLCAEHTPLRVRHAANGGPGMTALKIARECLAANETLGYRCCSAKSSSFRRAPDRDCKSSEGARFADKCCHNRRLSAANGIGSSPCLGSSVCPGGSIRMTDRVGAVRAPIGPEIGGVASRHWTSPELYHS
jgi:hypothetical protein